MSEKENFLLTLLDENHNLEDLKKLSKLKSQELFTSLFTILNYHIEKNMGSEYFVEDATNVIYKIAELVEKKQIPKSYGHKTLKKFRKTITTYDDKYLLKLINLRLSLIELDVLEDKRTRYYEKDLKELDQTIFEEKNYEKSLQEIKKPSFSPYYANDMHIVFHLFDEYLKEVKINENHKNINYYRNLIDNILILENTKINKQEEKQLRYEIEKAIEKTRRNKSVKNKKTILNHLNCLNDKITNKSLILFKTNTEYSYTQNRADLTKEFTFSIDAYDTKIFDDAISIKNLSNGNYLVGIHIVDPNALAQQLTLNEEKIEAIKANEIVSIPLFKNVPQIKKLTLKQNEARPTKSLMIELTNKGEVVSYEFIKSIIKVNKNYTYEAIDQMINNKTDKTEEHDIIVKLAHIAEKLREKNNAKEIYTGLKIIQRDPRRLSKTFDFEDFSFSKSRMIVQEAMILYNQTLAKHYQLNDLPMLYKNKKDLEFLFHETAEVNQTIRYLKKLGHANSDIVKGLVALYPNASYSTKNIGNSSLQLSAYANATSPLRYDADKVTSLLLDNFYFQKPNDKTVYKIEEQLKVLGPYFTNESRITLTEKQKEANKDAKEYLLKLR